MRLSFVFALFCSALLSVGVAVRISGATAMEKLYIGTYSKNGSVGIYMAEFDPANGRLGVPELAAQSQDPSFLAFHPNKRFLYAVNEGSEKVSAYAIDSTSGKLPFLNSVDTGGDGPCHLSLDATGKMLIVANYGAGSFAVFPVGANGEIGARSALVKFSGSGPNHSRQEGPHAHSVVFSPNNQFVFIDDLGTDRTMIYHVDPVHASVTPAKPPFAAANPGAGPRHLVIDPKARFVYVLNEVNSTITRFRLSASQGEMQKLDTVSSLPPDFHGSNTAAEIAMSRSGRFLYASNRGHDSVSVFQVGPDGSLQFVQDESSGGKTPRSFTIDPSGKWLLTANQDSHNIAVFRIDESTGKLSPMKGSIPSASPVCLLFR